MSKIDTGVSRIAFEPRPLEACHLFPDEVESIKKSLLSGAKAIWSTNAMDEFYKFELIDGELVASKMISYHKSACGKEVPFDICENSDIRSDRVLPKLYLEGQLGGVPQLDTFGDLFV